MKPMKIYFSLRQKDLVDLEATAFSHEFGCPTHDLIEPLEGLFLLSEDFLEFELFASKTLQVGLFLLDFFSGDMDTIKD